MSEVHEGQGPAETLQKRLGRWLSIAEKHAARSEGYKLYPGDWAALASVLSQARRQIPGMTDD